MSNVAPRTAWSKDPFRGRLLAMVPVSVVLHVAIIGTAIMGPCQQTGPAEMQVQYVSVITLPPGSLDGGGKRLQAAPAATAPPAAPAPTPPPAQVNDDSMKVPAPTNTPQPAATAVASAASALERAKQRAEREARRRRALANAAGRLTPTPAPGTGQGSGAGEGTASDTQGIPGGTWGAMPGAAPYEALVRATIEAQWLPPTWFAEEKKDYACSIHIKIGFDGRIVSRAVVQGSGRTAFDQSALAAIDKTERLPIPPEETREFLLKRGITLRFNPRSQQGPQ